MRRREDGERERYCRIVRKTFIGTNRTNLVARQNAVGSSIQPLHEGTRD